MVERFTPDIERGSSPDCDDPVMRPDEFGGYVRFSALTAAGYRLIGPGSVEPIDYEKIDIPADIQQFGERNKIPEFASATYRNGYVDGYRFALRSLQGGDGNA